MHSLQHKRSCLTDLLCCTPWMLGRSLEQASHVEKQQLVN